MSRGLARSNSVADWLACCSDVAHVCVLELVARYIDVVSFAQKVVANSDISVRTSFAHSPSMEEHL